MKLSYADCLFADDDSDMHHVPVYKADDVADLARRVLLDFGPKRTKWTNRIAPRTKSTMTELEALKEGRVWTLEKGGHKKSLEEIARLREENERLKNEAEDGRVALQASHNAEIVQLEQTIDRLRTSGNCLAEK